MGMIADLFTDDGKGNFSAFMSDLECNITGSFRLQSGRRFDNLRQFMRHCKPHYKDGDLTHWTFRTAKGKAITIFNT